MKVLVVDPSLFTLPYDAAFCRALARAGAQVGLVGRPLRRNENLAPAEFSFRPLFYRASEALPHPPAALKGLEHARGLAALARLIRRDRPDIVHLQWLAVPLLDRPFLAATGGVTRLVFTAHNSGSFHDARSRLQALGLDGALRRFAAILAHTEKTRAWLEAQGVEPSRILLLPHPPLELAADGPAEPVPPAEPGVVTVLLWGAIKPYKGLDVLVRAVVHHLPAELPLRVVVAGRPFMDLAPLRAMIDAAPHRDRFRFDLGFLSEARLAAWIRAADIVVFPYRTVDGSGALAATARFGKPIVASAIGTFAEEPARGLLELVPSGDPAALAARLQALILDPERRRAAGANTRRLAQLLPSWDRFAAACLERYEQLLAERGPASAPSAGRARGSLRPLDPACSRHQTRQPPRS